MSAQGSPLLRKLLAYEALSTDDQQAAMQLCSNVRAFDRHQSIVAEGAGPEYVHVMLEGWSARSHLRRDGSRRLSAFLIPGDFCDIHVPILGRMDHEIVTLTRCKVGYIGLAALEAASAARPLLTRAFWRATLVDEAVLRKWLMLDGSEAFVAVGHLLCELHLRMRIVGLAAENALTLPLTQSDLGEALALTSVHVNRTLGRLRQEGLIEMERQQITIPDVAALRRAAEFDPTYLHLEGAVGARLRSEAT